MSTINLSDSSDSDDGDFWENKMIYLRPNHSWGKPLYKTVVLSNASLTVRPEKTDKAHAILQCCIDRCIVTLCSLNSNKPSQRLQVVWAPDQEMTLINTGNHPITLALLVKRISF